MTEQEVDDLIVRATAWFLPRALAVLALLATLVAHRILLSGGYFLGTAAALAAAVMVVMAVAYTGGPDGQG